MDRSRRRERLESFARAAGLLGALALSNVSILDPDLPWHLSAARRLVETGAFPRADFLSWTMAGRPWIDFEWGSELIFYGLLRAGGTPALWLLRAASLFGATLLLLGLLRLWKVPRLWDALAAPFFAAALCPIFGLRPEMFSLLLFLLEFHILERRRLGAPRPSGGAFLLLHAGLYAVWANLHAGFAAGLLLCFGYGVGELFSRPEEAVPLPFLAAAAGVLGTLATPYGVGLYAVLFDHWRHAGALRRLIEEWKAPSFFLGYLAGYWMLVVFSLGGMLWAVRRGVELSPEHVAAAALFGFFGSRSIRTTTYAMATLFPLGLDAWNRLALTPRARRALALAGLAAAPFAAWRGYSWAGSLRFVGWPSPLEAQGPAGATAFLRREKEALSGLKLYNPYNWGGYLGYALAPDGYRVFIDGRYIFADLLAEVDAAERAPADFRAFITGRGADVAVQENDGLMVRDVMNPWSPTGRPYQAYAWPRADWAIVYWDADAVVFVRKSAVPPAWLKAHEYRWLRPHDLRQIGLYVVAGNIPLADVKAEIERYRREIGDPRALGELTAWYERFSKGAPPAAARRRR